ncbi:MAG: hypothetical protein LC541_20020 [Candidatus Thiodiazotropha sp.]|nr:hypothetical protein [Candidatus Thiodiazotropha sp.]MCM8885555.1 hypothetical protein [Candidatus Thiodiazotropha sp.]MCM8922000.1 hypothetical protein [Candidatus Thiodiazotropha sp.]
MENPYSSPESDLGAEASDITKRSIWWKIYFFVITTLSFLGMATFLVSNDVGFIDYLELMLLIVATAGLFGFVFSRKVLFPKFWLPFLVVYFVAGLFYESLSSVDMRQGMSDGEFYISIAIGYLMSIPAYYGIYMFGKADRHPWKNA